MNQTIRKIETILTSQYDAESEYKMPIGTWNCTDMELHIGGTR